MTYAITPVTGAFVNSSLATAFPATFAHVLMSAWVELQPDSSGFQQFASSTTATVAQNGFHLDLDPPGVGATLNVSVANGNAYDGGIFGIFGAASFDASGLVAGTFYNILVSISGPDNIVQCYVNDVALPSSGATWFDTTNISQPIGLSADPVGILAENNFAGTNPCMADAYWATPASFFDLSVTANRRKFINSDLTPVYLGANGQLPLGIAPLIFLSIQSGGVASDFNTNLGSGGGSFSGLGALCGMAPVTDIVSLADLFFTPTAGFVDLTVQSNRRNFVSPVGAAQDLGQDGSAPFQVAPPVFLSSTGTAASFATNGGRGGTFAVSGGTLATASTNPPSAAEPATTYPNAAAGQGVVGDYLTGNLYAFNPATYTDNGTQKRWVRRWRALEQSSFAAKKFSTLYIDMQTGAGMSSAANPQLMLRWSDDGGRTWSDQRIQSAGRLGQTAQSIKFNRLGSTRRWGGPDRIFELSSSDPFAVAILGAEVDD